MIVYRVLISLFAAVQLLRAARRGGRAEIAARLGRSGTAARTPRLWLHAASNGELASARPVIEAWRAARPGLPLVVTCNSESGVALARSWGLDAAPAPLDLRHAVSRFCTNWCVAGHIAMESELWPNRFAQIPGPVVVLGARMSARSARGWGRFPGLASRTLGRVAFLSAQDAASRDRLAALGLPAAATGPVADLKAFYAPPADLAPDPALAEAFPRAETWLAASIHEEDEAMVVAAHARALQQRPGLRLIVAPRHPRRGDALHAALSAALPGTRVARRSAVDDPAGAGILLADTLGEMPLWYALSGVVFVGGTTGTRGGHTPYEPARFGAALLHGPDTANFRAPFAALDAAGAAIEVTDADALAAALGALADPGRQRALGTEAARLLRPETDLDALMQRVLAHFPAPGAA